MSVCLFGLPPCVSTSPLALLTLSLDLWNCLINPAYGFYFGFRLNSITYVWSLTLKCICDEWGGAESRGNGARPVELTIMSDTCATHRSRVPRRSSGRIKGGATTVEDERGPGLDFNCVLCAAVVREGLPLYFCVCLFVY